jgi:hypothetical protein
MMQRRGGLESPVAGVEATAAQAADGRALPEHRDRAQRLLDGGNEEFPRPPTAAGPRSGHRAQTRWRLGGAASIGRSD